MEFTPEWTLLSAIVTVDWDHGLEEAVAAGVTVDDFLLSDHRLLWRAMLACREKSLPLGMSLIADELLALGMRAETVGLLFAQLMEEAPLEGQVACYSRRVKKAAKAREIAKTIELANSRIAEGENEEWVRKELAADLTGIEMAANVGGDRTLVEIGAVALPALRDRMLGDVAHLGLSTGIEKLDRLTTGINAGELWIVGGMPGRGKTAFGLQVARHLVENGVPVYLISLEMSAPAIWRRMVRMKFGSAMLNPGKRKFEEICEYEQDLGSWPLYINDESDLDVSKIASFAKLRIRHSGSKLVVVDYLQLIKAEGRERERREIVSDATNQLRVLAKDTGVPVMALSQLRRPQKINDRPTMIDLKESGDIESHAHVVLLLYMPVADDGGFTGNEEIIIGKQREGPLGQVDVYYHGDTGIFANRTRREG